MNQSKKRTKNKQELSPKSGPRKKVERKPKIKFEFELECGKKVRNGEGRIKVAADGGVSCLVQSEEGWKGIKAKILFVKLYYEPTKLLDKTVTKRKRRVPRKSA